MSMYIEINDKTGLPIVCERADIYSLFFFILIDNTLYFILLITFFKSGIDAIDILIFMLGI